MRDFTGGEVYPGAGAPHLVFKCLPAVLERSAAATTVPIAQDSVFAAASKSTAATAVDDAVAFSSGDGGGGSGSGGGNGDATLDWGLLVPDGASDTSGPSSAAGGGTTGPTGTRRRFVADGALGRLARWLRCLGAGTFTRRSAL